MSKRLGMTRKKLEFDVESDLNGTFQMSLEVKWKTVEVEVKKCVSVKIISNKKQQLQENQILMKMSRSENRHGLVRNIVYLLNKNCKVVNSKLVLQYCISKKVCGNVESVEYTVPSHGNCKKETLFYFIKKSTISDCKNQLLSSCSKRSVSVLYDRFCQGFEEDYDYGDQPRSKKQLADLCWSQHADNEVGDILGYNEEFGDDSILWYHGDIPTDLWVIGTEEMLPEIPRASKHFPLSVDSKFNFGAYEVTPVTYRNMLFECKSRNMRNVWVQATMIGPVIIHHDKSTPSYDTALPCIAKKLGIEREDLCVITDGEQALIDACNTCFKNCTMLRCTRNFEANCREVLKKIGVSSNAEEILIEIVLGESGLIEAEDKIDLKEKLKESIVLLSDLEQKSMNLEGEDGKGKFTVHIEESEKPILRKVVKIA